MVLMTKMAVILPAMRICSVESQLTGSELWPPKIVAGSRLCIYTLGLTWIVWSGILHIYVKEWYCVQVLLTFILDHFNFIHDLWYLRMHVRVFILWLEQGSFHKIEIKVIYWKYMQRFLNWGLINLCVCLLSICIFPAFLQVLAKL